MQIGLRGFFGDPALTAMGLVPARFASSDAAPGALSWRTAWIALGLGLVVVIALFRETALRIVTVWYSSATFNHGFLILPIFFYLIWLQRAALAGRAPRPYLPGALWILAAGLAWLAGQVGGVNVIQQIALVAIVQGLFIAILGPGVCRLLLFPLAYLYFAAPFGEALIPPLQDLTASFVVVLLRLLNVPVFHDGIFIAIPTGNFLVAAACSGVRFLIATLALGFLFAHLTYHSWWRKAAFMVCAAGVPIVANGLRAFGLVYVAHLTDGSVAVGVDHVLYGWMFFAIVTVILLGIGMTFRDRQGAGEPAAPGGAPAAAARLPSPPRILVVAGLAMLAAVVAPAYAMVIEARPLPAYDGVLPTPRPGGGWRLAGVTGDAWVPRFPGADARLQRTYVKDGRTVGLFVAYYAHQRDGKEMIGMGASITGGRRWATSAATSARASLAGGAVTIRRVRMVAHTGGRIAYQWYWIGGTQTSNVYYAKYLQTRQTLLGGSAAAAAIVVSADYIDQPAEADPALLDFIASLPPVDRWLGAAARGR